MTAGLPTRYDHQVGPGTREVIENGGYRAPVDNSGSSDRMIVKGALSHECLTTAADSQVRAVGIHGPATEAPFMVRWQAGSAPLGEAGLSGPTARARSRLGRSGTR